MKRRILYILLAALLLCGCSRNEKPDNTATFYYLRSEIAYGSSDGVIAPEEREIPANELALSDLLSLYMMGPVDTTLSLPLPTGTRLTNARMDGTTLTVTFSAELSDLDSMNLSIACACIGYTCFSLTDAEIVRIEAPASENSGFLSFTVTRDTFLLYDSTTKEADAS